MFRIVSGHWFCFFCLLFLGYSCESEDKDKIIQAQNLLTNGNCQLAIDILKSVKGVKTSRWYQTRASAQACFSKFTEVSFFNDSIRNIVTDTSKLGEFGRSLSSLELSSAMQSADDKDFISLYEAVDIIKEAGDPATLDFKGREKVWTEKENTRMSLQAGYMNVTSLGMYMNYHGDADKDGYKGGGNGNSCYLDYYHLHRAPYDVIASAIVTFLGSNTNSCVPGSSSGSEDLIGGLTGDKLKHACEGVVSINTLLDTISYVILPEDSGELGGVVDILRGQLLGESGNGICVQLISLINRSTNPSSNLNERICSTTSFNECVQIGEDDPVAIELYFLSTFEYLHEGT